MSGELNVRMWLGESDDDTMHHFFSGANVWRRSIRRKWLHSQTEAQNETITDNISATNFNVNVNLYSALSHGASNALNAPNIAETPRPNYTLVPKCGAALHGKVWRIEPPHKVCSFSKFTYLSRFLATHFCVYGRGVPKVYSGKSSLSFVNSYFIGIMFSNLM